MQNLCCNLLYLIIYLGKIVFAKSSYLAKSVQKQKTKSGIWLLINYKNALNPANSNMQKKCAGLCIQEKLKLCKFPVEASMQKSTQKFLSEIVRSIDWEVPIIHLNVAFKIL